MCSNRSTNTATDVLVQGVSSTGTTRNVGRVTSSWTVSTDATRRGLLALTAEDFNGNHTGLQVDANGASAPTAPADVEFVNGLLNGQQLKVSALTELLTIAAAATTDTSLSIPAGALVLAVSARVVTVIPTAATFTVTGASSGTTFDTAAVSTAAGSTDPGTAAGCYYNASSQHVRITPNLTPGAATGQVRVTVHYITCVPPTS